MHQYFVKPSKDNKQNIFIPIINKCSFILSKKRKLILSNNSNNYKISCYFSSKLSLSLSPSRKHVQPP